MTQATLSMVLSDTRPFGWKGDLKQAIKKVLVAIRQRPEVWGQENSVAGIGQEARRPRGTALGRAKEKSPSTRCSGHNPPRRVEETVPTIANDLLRCNKVELLNAASVAKAPRSRKRLQGQRDDATQQNKAARPEVHHSRGAPRAVSEDLAKVSAYFLGSIKTPTGSRP